MLIVEVILFPLFVIFFNLDVVDKIPILMIIFVLGSFGLSALGTLFSAMTVQIRAREVLLPVLLLPLAVPLIIGSVEATRGVLSTDPFSFYRHWMELVVIFDVVFTIVSFWVFEFIMDY
jgi:heme exporter protein B